MGVRSCFSFSQFRWVEWGCISWNTHLGSALMGGGREQCPHLGTAMPDVGKSGQTQADH